MFLDPEICDAWRAARKVETGAKRAERRGKMNADPVFKARASELMRKLNEDPEFKARLAEGCAKGTPRSSPARPPTTLPFQA